MTREPRARPSSTLSTMPVALDPYLGWLLHLAWIMPVLPGAVRHIWAMVLTPEGTGPPVALATWGIPYVETSSAYTETFASYWVADHWNQRGHRAIAAVLSAALRPYVLGQQ